MEKRRYARINLSDEGWRAELINQLNDDKLGDVVNLSEGGAMIITPLALQADNLYQTECRLTGPDGQTEGFAAGMTVLWRADAAQPGNYWAGLQIIDIDEDSRGRLEALTRTLVTNG